MLIFPYIEHDISTCFQSGPCQPACRFPTTTFGKGKHSYCRRPFIADWYLTYPWLEYSVKFDRAYCFACRHYRLGTARGRTDSIFTTLGYSNWKRANGKKGKFLKHEKSTLHRNAMAQWHERRLAGSKGKQYQVDNLLSTQDDRVILANRRYVKSLAEVVILCAEQNIAFRGHDESEGSSNPGNFRAIVELLSRHDHDLKRRMEFLPACVNYKSPEIQNELIELLGSMIRERICREVQQSGAFCLMCDESRDVSKDEQLAVVIRYVLHGNVYERFCQ